MPTATAIAAFDHESDGRRNKKNSQVRAMRRSARRDSQARESARSRRGGERRLSVRGELRDHPDVQKVARAVIQLALAQAEADAQAERQTQTTPDLKGGTDV